MISARAGKAAASDRWFAEAVRQAPRLPFAHTEWAWVALARGDADAAITLARHAHGIQPRFADPLKYWGDGLSRQRKERDAIRRYRMAAEYAPRWGALHLDWGVALWRLGRRDEALEKWRAAAEMDLSRTERARLQGIMARARG